MRQSLDTDRSVNRRDFLIRLGALLAACTIPAKLLASRMTDADDHIGPIRADRDGCFRSSSPGIPH